MSYVVLARKYRPLRFEDMVGQEHVGRTLGNAIEQNRVHHAYLFAGARGLGKTTSARIFAKGLVCEKGPTAEPCNACEQCVAVNEVRSVDVIEIDGASNNSVDNIRQLREQVHYLPQTARRKVYIIDEVHMLTTSAFNALLKTLEEPPAHVNFIFATTEPQKVLPTILSRVSRLDFRRVSIEELVAHLSSVLSREGLAVDDGGLRLIARAAGGSVRDSLTLLDQVIAFADDPEQTTEEEARRVLGQADRAAVAHLVDAILDSDPDAVIERFGALVGGGLDLMVLSIQILEHFRDLTLASVCRSPDVFRGATESEIEAIRSQAKRADVTRLGQLFDRFTRIVDRLPTSRVQRLLLEMGLLELAHSEPLVPIGDLVERLQALGAGGDGGGPTGASGASRRGSGGARGGVASGGRRAAGQREAPGSTAAAATSPEPPGEPQFESEFEKKLWKMGQGAVTKPPAPPAELSPFADERAGPPGPGEGSPCTPAPPAAGIIDLEHLEAFEAFEELVGRIRAEDEYVSAVLGEVGLVTLADGVLRVAAPPRSFAHTELTGRPEIRAQVEQATRDHFGRPFSLELVEGEASLPDLPSIVLMQAKRREEHRATVEAEAREHAAIRSLVETFDARITTTKPLQDPPLRTTPRQGT